MSAQMHKDEENVGASPVAGSTGAPRARHHRLRDVRRPAVMKITTDPLWRVLTDLLYVVLFCAVSCLALELLQWSINPGQSLLRDYVFSSYLHDQVLFAPRRILLLNLLLLMLLYIGFVFLTNHFWAGTATFLSIIVIYSVANQIKMLARNEPILASDLQVAGGNTGEILTFMPTGSGRMVAIGIISIIVLIALAVLCGWYFGAGHVLHVRNTPVRIVAQILLACVPWVPFTVFAATVGNMESPAHGIAMAFDDQAKLFNAQKDSNLNGTLLDLLRGFYVKVMDEPEGYSKKAMAAVSRRYTAEAAKINATRAQKLTDQNVVLVLSESFSDPTRVPGISLRGGDPIPYIRSLKTQTTAGLMLSSGYGGGTANLEFQAITGLSTADFNASLKSPYQQFVSRWESPTSFNQLWNVPGSSSVAFHAANGLLYLRHSNYKNFGFSHFWTLDGPEYVTHKGTVEKNPLVSDADSYQNVTDYLRSHTGKTHFVQMATIQNHMPYPGEYYHPKPFISSSSLGAGSSELGNINTYSRGINYTDAATKKFLDDLDALDKPTTVIWYGDHLPGIYPNEIGNPKYALTMHETDYFIWSNKASRRQGATQGNAAYTSPNYLMAQAAGQMDAQVTPYLAFLTRLHEQVPAMQSPLETKLGTDWDRALEEKPVYLNEHGQRVEKLTATQKRLLHDYKLITYDLTVGGHYLQKDGFTSKTTVPKAAAGAKTAE